MVGVAAGVAGVPSIQTCETSLRLIFIRMKFVSSGDQYCSEGFEQFSSISVAMNYFSVQRPSL